MELPPTPSTRLHHPLWPQLKSSPSPAECALNLRTVLPLQQFDARTSLAEWWHRDGELPLSLLPIAASVGSPCLLECTNHPLHWLLLLHDGQATVKQNGHSHALTAGDGVILPGQPWTFLGQTSSITTIGFDPLLVLHAARSMAPPHWSPPSPGRSPLRDLFPLPIQTDGQCAVLVRAICLELPAIHQMTQLESTCLDGFRLHETLYRIIAAIVFAELRDGQTRRDSEPSVADKRLDRLLDYITLHLAEPLPLSVLEVQSHYSRRALHYAFQERFGCSPMQWIRQQRMELARQRLEHPNPGDTVASVAADCGYRSQSRFRIDFERAYGCKPSSVLRGTPIDDSSNNTNSLAP
ncbi:MAG: AraC family transcriptional regulator [Cyanobacteriota bacterium]|nr:AraC family transcriptional regulator [Cyanobacteriota bacterium]